MTAITASCLCGATRLTLAEAPRFGIRCYCTDCRHASGGGSAPQVGFSRATMTVSGPMGHFHKAADSGSALDFGFCSACGSPMTKTTSRADELVFVYAGALDDASLVPDLKPVFEDSRVAWDQA